MSKKYGNDHYWFFIEPESDKPRMIPLWQSLGKGEEEVMGYATDRYNAEVLVNALIVADAVKKDPQAWTKHEMLFLKFVSANCPAPYSVMAENAILWYDRKTYEHLKAKFHEIY